MSKRNKKKTSITVNMETGDLFREIADDEGKERDAMLREMMYEWSRAQLQMKTENLREFYEGEPSSVVARDDDE